MDNRILTFKGTHFEIGEQVGELYKKWGSDYFHMPQAADQYYNQQLKTYAKFFPAYLEFLKGLAKGVGKNKNWIYKFSLTIFLSVTQKIASRKCSVFIVKNNRGIFVGRNYDWFASAEKNAKMIKYRFTDDRVCNLNGLSDMGIWQPHVEVKPSQFALVIEDAWNEHGLYIGINGAPDRISQPGMTTPHVVQLIGEQCKNVGEAIRLLERIPTTNSQIFTLADKTGQLVVVEKSIKKGMRLRQSNHYVIATNHYCHPDLLEDNRTMFEKVPFHSSFARYHFLEYNLLSDWKKINLVSIIPLMKKPPTLQNWRGKMSDTVTCWTLGLNLKDGHYQVNFAPLLEESSIIHN